MELTRWMQENNRSIRWVADILGCTTTTVRKHMTNENFPPSMCFAIYEFTEKQVLPHEISPLFFPVLKIKEIYGCSYCRHCIMRNDEVVARIDPKELRRI